MIRRLSPVPVLALLAALLAALAAAGSRAQTPQGSLPTEPITIESGGKRHAFTVELARTPAERATGLMFRTDMPADHGMLFDYDKEQPVAMWMKNTFIPLDMVFIRADGSIANIAEWTAPRALDTIGSEGPVKAVLELNGGTAARLGLKAGDHVHAAALGGS